MRAPHPLPPYGMISAGNINPHTRPVVRNPDGSISTVRTISVGMDGGEVLMPTVSPDGHILSDEDAIQLYQQTGQNFGTFRTPEAATAFAERLHNSQAEEYGDKPQMSQLDRIAEGIRRAHAKGDVEAVKKLGVAYRQMQANATPEPTSGPPAGAKPGTREYANWAREQAMAGKSLPQVSDPKFTETQSSLLDPFVQGVTFGWGDELRGLVQGGIAAAQGGDFNRAYTQVVDESRASLDQERRNNPVGSLVAEFAGAIPTGIGAGGQLAGRGATLGARALSGLGVGAGQGAVYGAGASDDDERLTGAALGGATGGIVGGAAPYVGAAARRLVTPAPASQAQTAAARLMQQEGVTLTAGQRTGSKKLQYLESELGGGAADAMMERQAEEFTGSVLRRIGVNANRATPEVVDAAYDAIGQRFDNLAAASDTPFDSTLQNNLLQVATDYVDNAGTPAPIVERMVNRLGDMARANGGRITGEIYQEVRSTLGRLSRNADPATRAALRDLQDALDDSIERNLSGPALDAWRDVRRMYRNYLVVERAVTSAGQNAASGLITPAQLRSAAVNQNRRAFARGANDFTRLANAAVQTMTPLPQSGTAPRMAARAVASLPAMIGAAAGTPGGIPGMVVGGLAGAAAPAAIGRALLSRPGRAALGNQWAAGPHAGVVEALLSRGGPVIAGQRD